jgi:uncharacterized small protein (DUF1192 family)
VIGEDEPLSKAPAPIHVVGQPLDTLSLHELGERIAALKAEIERLEGAMRAKQASAAAAAAVFKS